MWSTWKIKELILVTAFKWGWCIVFCNIFRIIPLIVHYLTVSALRVCRRDVSLKHYRLFPGIDARFSVWLWNNLACSCAICWLWKIVWQVGYGHDLMSACWAVATTGIGCRFLSGSAPTGCACCAGHVFTTSCGLSGCGGINCRYGVAGTCANAVATCCIDI